MPAYVERSFLITIQVNNKLAPPPAVLITGCFDDSCGNTAELFLPSTGTSCALPQLPDSRFAHTADNNIFCGGKRIISCVKWSPETGTWEELVTLDVERYKHVSWTPGNGIGTYLIGGDGSLSKKTSTLIKPDGSQEPSFFLKYQA